MAPANVTREGKTFPGELIVSNVKVIVQQQQQKLSLLWDTAIPAKQSRVLLRDCRISRHALFKQQ